MNLVFRTALFLFLVFFIFPATSRTIGLPDGPPAAVQPTNHGVAPVTVSETDDNQVPPGSVTTLFATENTLQKNGDLHGPGAVLDELLENLEIYSVTAGDGVGRLLSGIPTVIPDLYRVFVTL